MPVRAASVNLRLTADALERVPRRAMIAAARDVKAHAARIAPRMTSTPRKPRKPRPIRLRAVDTIRDRPDGSTSLRVQGVPVGPWVWVNTGTDAHLVGIGRAGGTRSTTSRTTRRARYLHAPGYPHGVRGPIAHPGSRGRRLWRKVQREAQRTVPATFARAVGEAVRRGR